MQSVAVVVAIGTGKYDSVDGIGAGICNYGRLRQFEKALVRIIVIAIFILYLEE